ncbi:hypothetical protein CS542_06855 [Pedobacter sp. IW39]|nr:hypothetical protein CS542_06855 [Pedobacter sp. IW39]
MQTDLFFAAKGRQSIKVLLTVFLNKPKTYTLSLSGEGRDLNNFKTKFSARYEFEEVRYH